MCAFEYMGICFAKYCLLQVRGGCWEHAVLLSAAPIGSMNLFLQYPLFLKEACAIVLCAVQTQSAMVLTAVVLFLLSFYLG